MQLVDHYRHEVPDMGLRLVLTFSRQLHSCLQNQHRHLQNQLPQQLLGHTTHESYAIGQQPLDQFHFWYSQQLQRHRL